MTSTMVANISPEGIQYLHKITELGGKHALKQFFNCDNATKEEILAKTFLVNELKSMKGFAFKHEKGRILLIRPVTIKITGMNKKEGRIVVRKKKVETFPICLKDFNIEGSKISFLMKFNPSENEPEEISKRVQFRNVEGLENYEISSKSRMISFENWNNIINNVITKMQKRNYSEDELLRLFFNTLKSNSLSKMSGDDVVNFRKIYENANLYYPDFAELSFDEKLTIFSESFKGIDEKTRDSYSLAMNTLNTLAKKGLITNVKATNPHSKRAHTLKLKKFHFRDGILRWVEYEDILYYSKKKISRGIEASKLWILLIDSSMQLILDKTSSSSGTTVTTVNR